MKHLNEIQPFWRGFEDKSDRTVPGGGRNTWRSFDVKAEVSSIENKDFAETDSEIDMALTSRKLCKLDAICAKLKSKGPAVGDSIDQAKDKQVDEDGNAPTDLSTKCLNNNIIGKVDLHNVDTAINNTADKPNNATATTAQSKTAEANGNANNNGQNISSGNADKVKCDISKSSPTKQLGIISNNVGGSSRRKSRKAAQPRNIAQVRDMYDNMDEKDELAEYEINNLNTNFPPEDHEDSAEVVKDVNRNNNKHSIAPNNDYSIDEETSNHSFTLNHSKSSSLNNSTNSKQSTLSSSVSDVFDETTPLDLSVSKSNEFADNEDSSDNEDYYHDAKGLVIDEEAVDKRRISGSCSPSEKRRDSGGEQAAHLKDYAESTMNELISMYGFGGANPTDLSKPVPVSNFKEILHSQMRALSALQADLPVIPSKKPKLSIDSESDDGSHHSISGIAPHLKSLVAGNQLKSEGAAKLQNDRFTSSSSFINAVFNASSSKGSDQLLTGKTLLPNYSKYLKRYNNGGECGGQHCKDLNYKEHYHCIDCSFQVFIKKEEMVRHYKWHKKREESLQHGFLRFSPLDNCSKRFGPCTHNRKQTHYHCLQKGCDKVYISTSDVQMHANYHRKDSAIMSEGFQRFRATEDCGTLACSFYGQRTTHFHCLRPDCKFTFKNKADMEKHKSYHQKDEVLGRDGFKKFMKYEHCNFQGCRYSKLSNHIHCIRSGCDYVLHSTAQLYSHKRKHERRDFEAAYKHFRTNQTPAQAAQQQQQQQQQQASGSQNNKVIIPRNDFGSVSQASAQSKSLKQPMVQAVPTSVIQTMAGLKRPMSTDQIEPLELKKPKLEPKSDYNSDVDMSGPPSPSTGRSSPFDGSIGRSFSKEGLYDDSDFSDHQDDMKVEHSSYDEDSLDLSGSLSLKIPLLQNSGAELGTSQQEDSKPPNPSIQLPVNSPAQFPAVFSPSSVPGTLPGSLMSVMNQGTLMTVPSTLTGPSTLLQPPKSIYNERREKDDSWKNYLVRYTANDPCNPRCQYLYKDHYHCKIDGCLVLFKSKDGVRDHARFHELQDRITPIAYKEYGETEACPGDCQYSEKERHYHCIWSNCTHVVPYIGPTFGRLEHYRIHEYARVAAGRAYSKSSRSVGSIDDNHIRRRGRPPKYPKIELPKIPKVELTDEEIRQSHTPVKSADGCVLSDQKVINGFRIFNAQDPCPDDQCNYIGRLHYHCARPRCFTITDRTDVLNLHAKDFHSFVKILEGYEFFDGNVSCRRVHCPNNQTNRHFHCTRPKCDYSFIRHSTMGQHEKKHSMSENGTSLPANETIEKQLSPNAYRREIPIRPASHTPASQSVTSTPVQAISSMIKTESGAYIPITSVKPNLMPNIPLLISPTQGSLIIPPTAGMQAALAAGSTAGPLAGVPLAIPISTIQALPPSVMSSQLVTGIPNPLAAASNVDSVAQSQSAPLTVLLQRGINQIPQPSWNEIKAKMHYGLSENCQRPFCKLKKKDHYHCYDCNQAFSDPARLRSHIGKHGIKFKRSDCGTKPLALVTQPNVDEKTPTMNPVAIGAEMGDMDPDEAHCLAENGNTSDSDSEEDKNSSSLNLNPSTFSEMIFKAQEQNKLSDFPEESYETSEDNAVDYSVNAGLSADMAANLLENADISSRSGRKITKTKHDGFMNSGDINFNKQRQTGSPKHFGGVLKLPYNITDTNHNKNVGPPPRGLKDDSVPDGYSRWKYNEECNYQKCAYRHSVTHFHCNRLDCGYGFSDRSRLVQHTLRHERIDSITGGELQQFRINQDCEELSCEFNKKMSHFHCKRCSYNCTDSSKVLTHRKYHAKLDSIANQGFRKFGTLEECAVNMCAYSKKQTHFHCLVESCKAAVLGLPQMNSHKLKHAGDLH